MAKIQTSYRVGGKSIDVKAERRRAYFDLADLLMHLHAFDIRLVSIVVQPGGAFIVTLDGQVPDEQLAHLGLIES